MNGQSRCPSCGYHIAVPSTPYTDASVALIKSLSREVEYLRLVVEQSWTRAHSEELSRHATSP